MRLFLTVNYSKRIEYSMFNFLQVIILIISYSFLYPVQSEIYRWTDSDGNIHYSDKDSGVARNKAEEISERIKNNTILNSKLGKINEDIYKAGKNITGQISSETITEHLPMTVYRLQKPLIPKARLLNMVLRKQSLWFSSDIGLIEFNLRSKNWLLYDKSTGLPGDTAYHIALDGERLFLDLYDWKGKNALVNSRGYWFDVEQDKFIKSNKTYTQVLAKGNFTTKNSDVLNDTITGVLHYKNKVWLTYTGEFVRRNSKEIKGGGVAVLNPLIKSGRQYTLEDGLAHNYCYDITSSENDSVWMTHWEEERGLSVLYDNALRWKKIVKSKNRIELGGVHIASAGHFILIGQQRSLVIYDRKSELAYTIDESSGLPGYIVSDILVKGEKIWVTAYSYGAKDNGHAGLIMFTLKDLNNLFVKLVQAYEDSK